MRFYLTFAALLSSLVACAFDYWFDTPKEAPAGITIIGSPDRCRISEGIMHVRAGSTNDRTSWGIIWDMTDTLNYTCARLTVPEHLKFDDHFGSWYGLHVVRVDSGRPTTLIDIAPGSLKSCGRGDNSLKLIFDDSSFGTARLYAGKNDLALIGDVPFSGGKFAFISDGGKVKVSRMTLELDTLSPPPFSQIYSPGKEPQPGGDHPAAGLWEFLDRDIKLAEIELGGDYRVALVPYDSDGYEIIYLSGGRVDSSLWQPGMIKGRLSATDFEGDFDLEWYDTRGRLHKGELNATLNPDGNLLTLNFPLWQASLRFRRITERRSR